jgi:hypothetical protein
MIDLIDYHYYYYSYEDEDRFDETIIYFTTLGLARKERRDLDTDRLYGDN